MAKLIAHRGGGGLRVENTLAAFENAIRLGAAGAELDVHLSRDGQIVVHHNPTLNRAYCRRIGDGWIDEESELTLAELSWSEMQDYEIGIPRPGTEYAKNFNRIEPVAGQRIPLLKEVIGLAKAMSDTFFLVIEIKTSILEAERRPWLPLVDATLDLLDDEKFGSRFRLCSFDWGSLTYARQRNPELRTWFTTQPLSWLAEGLPPAEDIPPDAAHLEVLRKRYRLGDVPWYAGFDPRQFDGGYPEAIAQAGGEAWFMYYSDCTSETVRDLTSRELESAAWSANLSDPNAIRRLVRTGVGSVCMDYPGFRLDEMLHIGRPPY